MNQLEMYKRLSNEDKKNLISYLIYDSVYDVARSEEVEISDEIAMDIQELAYDLYLADEYYNVSSSRIAFFLAKCYSKDKESLNTIKEINYDDVLEAITDGDYDFYKDDEMER